MRFQLVSLFVAGLIMSVSAVPELEHDLTEVNMKDCQVYSKYACLRECPRGYSAVFRAQCFAAEDSHECCAVRCCRSIHTEDDQEDEGMENAPIRNPYPQNALGASSRSGFQQ